MEAVFDLITLVAAGLFAGGAVYVSLAEHPGRSCLSTRGSTPWLVPAATRATMQPCC
jgi:hypothetical protein